MRPPLVLPALSITDAFEMALADADLAGRRTRARAARAAAVCRPRRMGRRTSTTVDALRDRFTGVKVQLLPSGPLSVLAPAAAAGDAVNLLQGALAVASPLQHGWRAWRVAAVLAASLLCLHLGCALLRTQSRCARVKPRSMPASRTPSAPPCPASRTPPMRGGASSNGSREIAAVAAAAPCCRRCRPSPMRAVRCRTRRSRASPSATAPSTCASIAPGCREPRCHRPAAARGELAGGHHGWQRQRRHLSRTPADPQGGCLMRALVRESRRARAPRGHPGRRSRRWCCCC